MSRRGVQTTTCRLCNKILLNGDWVLERREYHVSRVTGVCPECAALKASRSEARTLVFPQERSQPGAAAQRNTH